MQPLLFLKPTSISIIDLKTSCSNGFFSHCIIKVKTSLLIIQRIVGKGPHRGISAPLVGRTKEQTHIASSHTICSCTFLFLYFKSLKACKKQKTAYLSSNPYYKMIGVFFDQLTTVPFTVDVRHYYIQRVKIHSSITVAYLMYNVIKRKTKERQAQASRLALA